METPGLAEPDQANSQTFTPPPLLWEAATRRQLRAQSRIARVERLVVLPNQVQINGQTITSLERRSDAWWAKYTCLLQVQQGALDSLRLKAPATWLTPSSFNPTAPAVVEVAPSEKRDSTVVVRFRDSIVAHKTVKLELRGRLATDNGEPLAVPQIKLETPFRGPQYVSVPASNDSQPIAWAAAGVRPTRLPGELVSFASSQDDSVAFEVRTTPFRVALQPPISTQPSANVRLADTLVTVSPFGAKLIVTRMIVVSHGLTECVLELPDEHEMVSLSTDGRPALHPAIGRTSLALAARHSRAAAIHGNRFPQPEE